MKNKHAVFPITMAGVAFLCFLFVALCMSTYVQPLWGETMVLILPSLILAVVAVLAIKGKLNRRMTEFVTLVLSIVLVVVSFFYTMVLSIWTTTTETTDVIYYERAYGVIDTRNGVKGAFPEEIPADAKEVDFRYFPGFLQGGEVLELSYTITAEALHDWETLLREKAVWIGRNGEWQRNHWGYGDEDAVRYQLYWDGGDNHGEIAYVLIDAARNRITFYYDKW